EHAATSATTDRREPTRQRFGERARTAASTLQQVKRHALRGLRPDAGKSAQRIDELGQRCRVLHWLGSGSAQNGILNPGGRFTPDITFDMRACEAASTLFTASLIAAAIRSSSISRS